MLPLLWKGIVVVVRLGSKLETSLTEDFQRNGHNVTCDNFFTDLKFAESLAKKRFTIIGMVKRNKRFLPKRLPGEKKPYPVANQNFSSATRQQLCRSKRNKNVHEVLLSSMHNTPDVEAANGKPDIVLEYNEANDGVDAMDKMANAFYVKGRDGPLPFS